NQSHGFLDDHGTFTTVDPPGSAYTFMFGPHIINASGQIVGYYEDGNGVHGFLDDHGIFTTIDVPGSNETLLFGINSSGVIVGEYYTNSIFHGFIYDHGTITTFDVPNSTLTWITDINDAGQITGYYDTSLNGQFVSELSFIATPNTVAPVMLDAVYNPTTTLTTLSGIAGANNSVSIFDGTNLVGTVTAGPDGKWSLTVNVPSGAKGGAVIYSYTETATDGTAHTTSAGVTLFAQASNQTLQGGSGNDVLIARPNDVLKGNAGNDTFVFNPGFGKVTISDFGKNGDQDGLRFDHTLFANQTAAQVISQAHDSTAGAVIVVDANNTVTLTGVSVAQLQGHASDIHFF